LLAHELAHVVQQLQMRARAPTRESDLEREATTAGESVMRRRPVEIRGIAHLGLPQFERIRFSGREFEVGDVRLHGQARQDVRQHGVLLPGPDQAHILVTGDGRLGYEVSHTNPDDPFRWQRLREIVDNGHLDIFAVRITDPIEAREVSGTTERVVRPTLLAIGGSGLTLLRRAQHQRIFPTEQRFVASPSNDRDRIYYETGARGRGLIGGNALAHELFGHLWLALRGVPFIHPPSVQEAEQEAARGGRQLSVEERARVIVREQRTGTLRAEHGIVDPFGRPFTGTVREYIERYAGASIRALQSPTQHVSEAQLVAALQAFRQAALAPGGLTRSGTSFAVSDQVGLQWEFLSNNYELLRRISAPTPGGHTAERVRNQVVRLYRTAFSADQRYAFDQFLSHITTSFDPARSRQRQLATDVQAEIRRLGTSR
jgi:hypothetical protein